MSASRSRTARRADESPREAEVIVRGVNLTRDFRCHLCGNCCRGAGFVKLTRQDEVRLAEFVGLPLSVFRREYCDPTPEPDGSFVLRDGTGTDACVFLNDDNTCRVHEAKPEQCVGFPLQWRSKDFFATCEGFKAAQAKARSERERP